MVDFSMKYHMKNGKIICQFCKQDHDCVNEHGLDVTSYMFEPLSFVISVQNNYDSPHYVSKHLAWVRAQLKEHYPNKQFEILPHSHMVTKEDENGVLHGNAYVCKYVGYEK